MIYKIFIKGWRCGMKKSIIIVSAILIISLIVAIIGVSQIDVLKSSSITEDADYQKYLELKSNGEIDENGEYIIKYEDPDKIRVTFATNKALNVEYYYDEAKTRKIDSVAYLMPADTIYIKCLDSSENLYKFSRYEIYEFDKDGNCEKALTLTDAESKYTIPENIKSKEVQIRPYGENDKSSIRLSVIDENGKDIISGEWKNGSTILKDNSLAVGPSESYQLSYTYNTDEFFFVSSSPECHNPENINGVINFEGKNSSDEDRPLEYVINLRRYLSLSLSFDKNADIYRKDELLDEKTKKFEFKPEHKLKFGDEITIKTKSDITITDGDYKYISASREWSNSEELYIYKIKINDTEIKNQSYEGVDIVEDVTITLPEKVPYGNATYKVNGKEVSGTHTFKEGEKLKIEYKIGEDGYIFSGQNVVQKILKIKTKTEEIEIKTEHNNTTLDLSELFKVEKEA